MSASPAAEQLDRPPTNAGERVGDVLGEVLGVVVLVACAVLSAVLEVLLVPVYVGSVIAPVAVLLAVLSNIGLPLLGRRLSGLGLVRVLPFAVWLIVVVGFGLVVRPEGDVILPGGSLQWVSYGLLLGGAIAGVLTLVFSAPAPRTRAGGPAAREVAAGRAPRRPAGS